MNIFVFRSYQCCPGALNRKKHRYMYIIKWFWLATWWYHFHLNLDQRDLSLGTRDLILKNQNYSGYKWLTNLGFRELAGGRNDPRIQDISTRRTWTSAPSMRDQQHREDFIFRRTWPALPYWRNVTSIGLQHLWRSGEINTINPLTLEALQLKVAV